MFVCVCVRRATTSQTVVDDFSPPFACVCNNPIYQLPKKAPNFVSGVIMGRETTDTHADCSNTNTHTVSCWLMICPEATSFT